MSTNTPEVSSPRESVQDALVEIRDRADENRRKLFRAFRQWKRLHYALGGLAVVLAAVSAGTGLASVAGRIPAAILAITSGAVTGLATFFASEKRSQTKKAQSAAWIEVKNAAQNMLDVKLIDDQWLTSCAWEDVAALREEEKRLIKELDG